MKKKTHISPGLPHWIHCQIHCSVFVLGLDFSDETRKIWIYIDGISLYILFYISLASFYFLCKRSNLCAPLNQSDKIMETGGHLDGGEWVEEVALESSDTPDESFRFVTYMILDTLESLLANKKITARVLIIYRAPELVQNLY